MSTQTSSDLYVPLPRAEVVKAVERRNPARIPLVMAKWWGEGLGEQYGERLREFDRYPDDVYMLWIPNPADLSLMNLSWSWQASGGLDSHVVLDDWSRLNEFIEKLPPPGKNPHLQNLARAAEQAHASGKYVMFGFWNLFFEKPWTLRGMQNLLMDYCDYPDEVNRLHDALCNTYCSYIREAKRLLEPDGFWTSDDLGHQKGPMMGPAVFHELIYPYYRRVGEVLRQCSMHFWLHSCGDNTKLLPDLIDAGVDVFHPVQKHTMDERKIVEQFGGRITFLAGIDVQQTLQRSNPEGVRKEVRFMVDTFDLPAGGMCIAAGNGIVSGTPFENIDAYLDEALRYGTKHRAGMNQKR